MTALRVRQLLACLLAGLLSLAPALAQSSAQQPPAATPIQSASAQAPSAVSQNTPPQNTLPETVPNESQLAMAPKPNLKTAKRIADLGDKATAEGRFDEALNLYQQALRYAPQDQALLVRTAQLRSQLVRDHVDSAERDALSGHADVAVEELAKALLIDPDNTIVAERIKEMKALDDGPAPNASGKIEGLPELAPKPGKQNLNFRGDSRSVYEQLGQTFGVHVTFDPDLPARTTMLRIDDVDFDTAAKVLMAETGTFYRVLTPNLIFVAQDNAEKRRQYEPVAEKAFLLPASVGNDEMTELLRLLKEMTGATKIELDSAARVISVRDTPERLALIGELIHQAEKARGEILLEIEVLEVDRNKARDLGLLPPSQVELLSVTPTLLGQLRQAQDINTLITLLAGFFGGGGSSSGSLSPSSSIPPLTIVGGGKTTFLLTLPAVAAQFSDALTLVHSGNQVLLRAQNGKPATFFVGDRYPITLSLLSGSIGPTTFTPGGPNNGVLPTTAYNVGNGPVALTAGDFRNLGFLDLAVLNEIDNTLTILQNDGQGAFQQATGSPISLGSPLAKPPIVPPAIATAQFTSSGFHDLLITDAATNTVSVLLSNGDDTFKEATGSPITVGKEPSALLTGDFNADGFQDFIVTNFQDNTLSVFYGNGDGTFKQATGSPFPLPTTALGPIAIATADFNNDGVPDLAIVDQTSNNVTVLLGVAGGGFTLAPGSPFAVGNGPIAIGTGDFNVDGKPDLAILNQADNTVSVELGNGDGTFTLAPNSPIATGQAPSALAVADFNGDGALDIAVTDPSTDSVAVFLGQGTGAFATGFEVPAGTSPSAILATTLGGGSTDVAITDDPSGTAGQVTVILNTPALFASAGLSGSTAGGVPQQPYPGSEYEDIGLKVKATPTLHANDEVTLQLEFEIRALSGSNINGIPILTNRTLSQTVRLKEDESTIISGLLDNEETKTITGLPALATLPTVGYVFGQRNNTSQDTEMLIMVTPRRMRLTDRISRTVYAGRDAGARGGSSGLAPAAPVRPPQ